MGKINQEVIIGSDTTDLVIHNIYPDGLEYPEHMMDPNIGGYKKCKHIYENVGTEVCPLCGRYTHETDWIKENKLRKKWLKDNPLAWKEVGWWSI